MEEVKSQTKVGIIGIGSFPLKRTYTKSGVKEVLKKKKTDSQFHACYDLFVKRLSAESIERTGSLRKKSLRTFHKTLRGFSSPLYKIGLKILVFIYSFLRGEGVNITFSLLVEISKSSRHECFHMLKQIGRSSSTYTTRNREKIILNVIDKVRSNFKLSLEFYINASKIFYKLWIILSNTTDRVVAGTVSVLSLVSIQASSPPYSYICKELRITQSAVIYQVKKIVRYFGISGFTTLNKSRDLLNKEVLQSVINYGKI
ncbi:hypothetical protein LCGC14_1835570 [marine sediment metagenome]|uniref:Uncharacterized protein n=1 Tax=marine sediment metagenome TaxID=412755 RepID=A0A0F9H2Z1_9ZZZZ